MILFSLLPLFYLLNFTHAIRVEGVLYARVLNKHLGLEVGYDYLIQVLDDRYLYIVPESVTENSLANVVRFKVEHSGRIFVSCPSQTLSNTSPVSQLASGFLDQKLYIENEPATIYSRGSLINVKAIPRNGGEYYHLINSVAPYHFCQEYIASHHIIRSLFEPQADCHPINLLLRFPIQI